MNSCVYKPTITDVATNKNIDSKFYNDLLSVFDNNRSLANKHYFIANHELFKDATAGDLKYDANGEVMFTSYKEITGLKIDEEQFLSSLNKQYNCGIYDDVDIAISAAQQFSNSSFKSEYTPSLIWVDNGKVKFSIVKKTEDSDKKLHNFIKNKNLITRIIKALENIGVAIDFSEEGHSKFNGVFNPRNAEKTYNGLLKLITIFTNDNVEGVLSEEVGHLLYVCMKHNPLIVRLYNSLTDDVLNSILPDQYKGYPEDYRKKEAIGRILGEALLKQNNSKFKNLIDRIILQAKKLFSKLTLNDVKNIEYNAELTAQKVVESFLSHNFTANLEDVADSNEIFYSFKDDTFYKNINHIEEILKRYVKDISQQSKEFEVNYHKRLKELNKFKDDFDTQNQKLLEDDSEIQSILYEGAVHNYCIESLLFFINSFENIVNNVRTLDLTDNVVNNEKITKIIEARKFITYGSKLIDYINENESLFTNMNDIYVQNIKNYVKKLKHLLEGAEVQSEEHRIIESLDKYVLNLETDAYIIYLKKLYGKDFVSHVNRVIIDENRKLVKFKVEEGQTFEEAFKDYLVASHDCLFEEDFPIFYAFHSYYNIKDPTMKGFDDLVRVAKSSANDNVIRTRFELVRLFDKLKLIQNKTLDSSVSTSKYYEKIDNKFTGNILQPVHWGLWEKNLQEEIEKIKEDFEREHPELLNNKKEYNIQYPRYLKRRLKLWHKHNSIISQNKYYPNSELSEYKNNDYNRLSEDEKQWIDEYLQLKTRLDNLLGDGRTYPHRLPQFRGDLVDRMSTTLEEHNTKRGIIKGIYKNLTEYINEKIKLTSDDVEFGSELERLNNRDSVFTEILNKLPLYGIKKLKEKMYVVTDNDTNDKIVFDNKKDAEKYIKDNSSSTNKFKLTIDYVENLRNLSRDLFNSTLLYSNMVYNYNAMADISKIREIVDPVYNHRQKIHEDGGTKHKPKRSDLFGSKSSYQRFKEFYQTNVYHNNRQVIDSKHNSLLKIANFASSIASNMWLKGNVISGVKDFSGKLYGIIREAKIGESLTENSVNKACKFFFKHCWAHSLNSTNDKAEDALSLFRIYFNVSDKLSDYNKEFRLLKNKLRKLESTISWAPFSLAASIETIVTLAKAYETKVIDSKTGEVMSAVDLFMKNKHLMESKNTKSDETVGLIIDKKNPSKADIDKIFNDYNIIQSISRKLFDVLNEVTSSVELTDVEINYIKNNNDFKNHISFDDDNNIVRLNIKGALNVLHNHELNLKFNTSVNKNKHIVTPAIKILHSVAGTYDMQSRPAFQNSWLGVLFSSQKGWYNGMVMQAGLSTDRVDPIKGDTEGYYITLAKFLKDFVTRKTVNEDATSLKTLLNYTVSSIVPFLFKTNYGKNSKDEFLNAGYSEHQHNNLQRHVTNLYAIVTLHLIENLLKMAALGLRDADDDDEGLDDIFYRITGILMYIAKCVKYEMLSAYSPFHAIVQSMNFISVNAFAPIAGLVHFGHLSYLFFLEFAEQVDRLINPDEHAEWLLAKDSNGKIKYKDKYKQEPIYIGEYLSGNSDFDVEKGDSKFIRKLLKVTPYVRHLDVIRNPIAAAENLEKVNTAFSNTFR